MRVYNFCAGPSTLPEQALIKVQKELLSYNGCGMSVMELSHRGAQYDEIHHQAEAMLRQLLNVPDDYYVLFLQGGASMQFEAIPMNLLGKNNKADYILTGNWAEKSYKEAKKYGDIVAAGSSKDANYTFIPEYSFREDIAYGAICSNNTIYGTKFSQKVNCAAPLVADMSSCILSEQINVSDYSVIYAGAQKNMSCAGLTVVIVKKELVDNDYTLPFCPTMLKWKTQAEKESLYNTPPTFAIYVLNEVLKWLDAFGGIKAMEAQNKEQAAKLYNAIDNSTFYSNPVRVCDRSIMNVVFTTPNAELDAKFVKESTAKGLMFLKGHKNVGGLRASIYNAMPNEGITALIEFMQKFENENK